MKSRHEWAVRYSDGTLIVLPEADARRWAAYRAMTAPDDPVALVMRHVTEWEEQEMTVAS